MRHNFIRMASIPCILSVILAGCGTISKDEQKKEVKSFVNKINQKEKPFEADLNRFVDVFSQFEDDRGSSANLSDLANASKDLKRDYTLLHRELSRTKSPAGLPNEVSSLLNNGVHEISNAYLLKSQGLDHLITFANSQDNTELIAFQKNMAKTQSELEDGTQKIKQASIKVGLAKWYRGLFKALFFLPLKIPKWKFINIYERKIIFS